MGLGLDELDLTTAVSKATYEEISHAQAIDKATEEYRKYQVQNLSPVEEEYLESIKNIQSIVKKKDNN